MAQVLSLPAHVNGKAHTVPGVVCYYPSCLPGMYVTYFLGTLRALSSGWPPGRDTEAARDTWLGGTKLI